MNYPIINNKATNLEYEVPLFIQEELYVRINQSTIMAEEYLKKNRPIGILNNVIKINGCKIDMYEELIIKDNFKPNEFAIVAIYSDRDMWFARKTCNDIVQYYHFTVEDSFSVASLFSLFIEGYTQKTLHERLGKVFETKEELPV
jgi:hypothetical protein